MNPEPAKNEKTFRKDMKTFEKLAAKTKELALLADRSEKSIGEESVILNKTIQIESNKP
ncbi:MAG: hypothetical protein Q8J74_06065 [Candidatus Didemnitutus sp.]|nr:hypothetical protein [Candidatus Didemnitutus sp.]